MLDHHLRSPHESQLDQLTQSQRWSRINGSPPTRLMLQTPKGAVEAKMQHVCLSCWCCWRGIIEKAELVGLDEREPVISIYFGPTQLLCLRMPVVHLLLRKLKEAVKVKCVACGSHVCRSFLSERRIDMWPFIKNKLFVVSLTTVFPNQSSAEL